MRGSVEIWNRKWIAKHRLRQSVSRKATLCKAVDFVTKTTIHGGVMEKWHDGLVSSAAELIHIVLIFCLIHVVAVLYVICPWRISDKGSHILASTVTKTHCGHESDSGHAQNLMHTQWRSMAYFLFRLKNLHIIPPRRFRSKIEAKV
jgi:hypothetical protein